jgi:DMSO reductase anchor subunit
LLTLAWLVSPSPGAIAVVLGLVTVCASLATIYCTAMIYASLKTVHQWCNPYVAPNYLALGLYSGALLLAAALHVLGRGSPGIDFIALVAGLAAFLGKVRYWHYIANTRHPSSPESATGLGPIGKVRLFEAPHTEENYLMREMGFTIARKHAEKLRTLSVFFLFVAPLVLTVIALLTGGVVAALVIAFAVLSAAVGVLVERWLFFAEARHVVTLFYGARAA